MLQEQKAFEVANRPNRIPAEAIAKIVETQELLRSQPGDLQAAANLIAERLQEITHATGVAIAVVRENQLEYCAATGDAASLAGSHLPLESSLSADGQLSTEFSQGHADQQSMALPLHHEGKLAGLLEVRFADADSIQEPDMRSCQLMAGLMTEAIARAADKEWRQALAAERAAMLEALERIKPQLERLAVGSAENATAAAEKVVAAGAGSRRTEGRDRLSRGFPSLSASPLRNQAATQFVPQCGYQFGEHELFCGRCGTARPETQPSGDLQSKWASLWHLQQAAERQAARRRRERQRRNRRSAAQAIPDYELPSELTPELKKVMEQFSDESGELTAAPESQPELEIGGEAPENSAPGSSIVLEQPKSPSPWGSASKARQWLESLHPKIGGWSLAG